MWDGFRVGDGSADCLLRLLACFGQGVVSRVKVLAFLELVAKNVLSVRQFAVQTEEFLLLFGEGLWVGSGLDGRSSE